MKYIIALALVLGCRLYCGADTVSDARHAIDQVVNRLDMKRNIEEQYFNYGVGCSTNVEYRALAIVISNSWQVVLNNIPSIATNQVERLLVFGTRDQFGEEYYIDFLGGIFELWQNGMVTRKEFEWTINSNDPDFKYLLVSRYNDERVRNLVMRFQHAEPDRLRWQKILSGAAYSNYVDRISAGYIQ